MPPEFLAFTLQKYCVLLLSGPTDRDVPVSVESSTTVDENDDDVEICTRYDVAPEEEFQLNVEVTATPPAPLVGKLNEGADGGLTEGAPGVVKLSEAQAPNTPLSDARTRQ